MKDKVEVRLTSPQIKIIESIPLPEEVEQSVLQAAKEANGTRVQIPKKELEQLAGWIAAEANSEERARRKQSVCRVYDEIQAALWEYEERRIAEDRLGPALPKEVIIPVRRSKAASSKKKAKSR